MSHAPGTFARTRHFLPLLVITALSVAATFGQAREAARSADPAPPGKLFDVGGYRLHLYAVGTGSPAVVFLNGAGDFSVDWGLVQPAVGRMTRAVAYDRAGDAWSDLGPTPRTMKQDSYELRRLLEAAGIPPPYVLVGHSYGGLLARVYAREYPGEVAGFVLVDPTHESTVLLLNGKAVRVREHATGRAVPPAQTMRTSPPRPPTAEQLAEDERMRAQFGPPRVRSPFDRLPAALQELDLWARSHPKLSAPSESFFAEELQQLYLDRRRAAHPLGDAPLVVLAGGLEGAPGGPPPGISAEEWKRIWEEKRAQKEDLARLSRRGRAVVDPRSGHHIHLDNPDLVVRTIREVVDAVRRGR